MPPLWQYVPGVKKARAAVLRPAAKKADEPIAAPKGRESRTPRTFPCKLAGFRGPHEGAIIAILDPWRVDAEMMGRRPCPVVAVLLACAKRQTSPSRTPKGANHEPPSLFPCKRTASRGPRKGATMPLVDPGRATIVGDLSSRRVGGEGYAPVVAVLPECW
jgi:hypothetical protein